MFGLVHQLLERPVWEEEALRRAKTAFLSSGGSRQPGLLWVSLSSGPVVIIIIIIIIVIIVIIIIR